MLSAGRQAAATGHGVPLDFDGGPRDLRLCLAAGPLAVKCSHGLRTRDGLAVGP
jgi:hypothetical protein